MASIPPNLKATIETHLGGRDRLERLLGLCQDEQTSTDTVFVSLDLEVASDRRRLPRDGQSIITQIGFAFLDTRDLVLGDVSDILGVRYFRVCGGGLKGAISERCRRRNKRPCVFAEKRHITPQPIHNTIKRNLKIYDDDRSLRSIVLVGHSTKEDLKVLHKLDINPFNFTPLLATIDTHALARYILPPFNPNRGLQPGQDFSLRGVLSEHGVLPGPEIFHNAGNDAVYTLYAMICLIIRHASGRVTEMGPEQKRRLETLTQVTLPDWAY